MRSGSTHGSVFIYFGRERKAFIREFQQFGQVVEGIECGDEAPQAMSA
jgi:hypothetical protein